MNPLRIVIATAVLSLGISGAFYVVKNGFRLSNLPAPNTSAAQAEPINNNLVNNVPFIESLSSQFSANYLQSKSGVQSSENLTSGMFQNLANTLVENNPQGPGEDLSGQKIIKIPDLEDTTNNLLASAIEKFDLKGALAVDESRLNISDDAGEEALDSYLAKIQNLITENLDKPITDLNQNYFADIQKLAGSKGRQFSDLSQKHLANLVNIYGAAVTALYKIPAPASALEFHKNFLSKLNAEQSILKKMSGAENDPLIILVATQALESINSELAGIIADPASYLKK